MTGRHTPLRGNLDRVSGHGGSEQQRRDELAAHRCVHGRGSASKGPAHPDRGKTRSLFVGDRTPDPVEGVHERADRALAHPFCSGEHDRMRAEQGNRGEQPHARAGVAEIDRPLAQAGEIAPRPRNREVHTGITDIDAESGEGASGEGGVLRDEGGAKHRHARSECGGDQRPVGIALRGRGADADVYVPHPFQCNVHPYTSPSG